ncbi:hypothetical protein HN510_03530, partial [Candidatus Woesearchaeota archaeon]|nr:hypothetical protein [Candidatus Woesearchaeota archaeon]
IKDGKVNVCGVPLTDQIEYVARTLSKEQYYVVHHPKEHWSYGDFRLHIGSKNNLIEAKIQQFRRLRDGGTTYISYDFRNLQGFLYFPTPFKKELIPIDNYGGIEEDIEKIDFHPKKSFGPI